VQNPGDVHAAYDSRSLKDVARSTAELALRGSAAGHDLLVRGYRTEEEVDYFSQPDGSNFVNFRTPTRWTGLQVQDVVHAGAHSFVGGFDAARAEARSERFVRVPGESGGLEAAAPYAPHSAITSAALFGEGRFSFLDDRLAATLGARLDRVAFEVRETALLDGYRANREDRVVFNPSAGLRYSADAGFHVRASGGRAFVTPDAFNVAGYAELAAGPGSVTITRGNPDLRPESSVTWELGAGFSRAASGIDLDIGYFHTDVRDRITVGTVAGGAETTPSGDTIRAISTYRNVDRAEIRGIEGSMSHDLGVAAGWSRSLRLFATFTRLLTADLVSDGATAPILNVADWNVNAGLEFDDLRRFTTRLATRYVGPRHDTDFSDWMNPGTVTFPSFLVTDLSGDVQLGDRYRVGARIENLTDENYYEVRGYPLPGRSLRLQLGVAF
jgi:vitamin B12 transporter